jgi:hypothetical protein
MLPLPNEAQVSTVNGMVADDFDGDGNLDLVINGNDFGTEVGVGRYDASNGLLLKGDGKGNFTPQSILQSGIYLPGNGKALVKLRDGAVNYLLAASENRGPMKILKLNRQVRNIPLNPSDRSAMLTYADGRIEKKELYYGSSFLSQSGRFITISSAVKKIEITDNEGKVRRLQLN